MAGKEKEAFGVVIPRVWREYIRNTRFSKKTFYCYTLILIFFLTYLPSNSFYVASQGAQIWTDKYTYYCGETVHIYWQCSQPPPISCTSIGNYDIILIRPDGTISYLERNTPCCGASSGPAGSPDGIRRLILAQNGQAIAETTYVVTNCGGGTTPPPNCVGRLNIESNVYGYELWVDGILEIIEGQWCRSGNCPPSTPDGNVGINLLCGNHDIILKKKGCTSENRTVYISSNTIKEMYIQMTCQPTNPCANKTCPDQCYGKELWKMKCDSQTGQCVKDYRLESCSSQCGCSQCPTIYDPDNPGCTSNCPDTDNDGVPDCKDQCPNTGSCIEVDYRGCPVQTPPPLPSCDKIMSCPQNFEGKCSAYVPQHTYDLGKNYDIEILTIQWMTGWQDCLEGPTNFSVSGDNSSWHTIGSGTGIGHKWTEISFSNLKNVRYVKISDSTTYVDNSRICVKAKSTEDPCTKDDDGDGVNNCKDQCNDPTCKEVDKNGCPTDADEDGVRDCDDKCPFDKGPANNNGCPKNTPTPPPENKEICNNGIDDDKDGKIDCNDSDCSNDSCCKDSDGDGVVDCNDECPNEKGTVENKGCSQKSSEECFDTGFRIGEDSYNFSNEAFTNKYGALSYESLKKYFPNILEWILRLVSNTKGNCYGMASTSALYFMGKLELPNSRKLFSYSIDDPTISKMILDYQRDQIPGLIGMIFRAYGRFYNPENEFSILKNNLEVQRPIILGLYNTKNWGKSHMVIAYRICQINENQFDISIYDNEDPTKSHIIKYYKHIKTFDYEYYSYDRFTSQTLEDISFGFTSEDINQYFINEISKSNSNILYLGSPANLKIIDEDGRIIGYENGEFINQIPEAIPIIGEDNQMVFIPNNLKYTIEIKGKTSGEFHFALLQTGNEIKDISYPPVPTTSQSIAKIDLNPTSQDYSMKSDNNGDGTFEETINPDKIEIITKEGKVISQESRWLKLLKGSPFAQYGTKSLLLIVFLILGNALILYYVIKKR